MKITKIGHSCMLVQENGARILIDPGAWSEGKQNALQHLDAILITHEHPDHLDPESIKTIIKNNPSVKIYTNKGVGKILSEKNIPFELLENTQTVEVKGVLIEAVGEKHRMVYPTMPIVDDTGYMIAEKFFYAGDAFHIPAKAVEILAWPAYTPWATLAETVDYAKQIKPKVIFPVHDAIYKFEGPSHYLTPELLNESEIEFKILEEGKEYEF